MSKTVIKRIITAGPLVQMAVYPAVHSRDGPTARQGKRALSPRAQQRMNTIYAWQKLKLRIAANFGRGDIFGTLTYDDSHLPENKKTVREDVRDFMKSLRNARDGLELRYIYTIEHKHGEGRWHVHILVNATGDDYEMIRRLWAKGGVEFRKLRVDREKNYETLAKYLCKEERDKPGERLWTGSLNLRQPQRECFRVPEGEPLRRPPWKKALALAEETVITSYGIFRYLEYVVTKGQPQPKAKRRRQKNKKAFL